MRPEEALALLEGRGAVLRGHFLLSSGRHSDTYVEKARVLEDPSATMQVAEEMASWFPGVEAVLAPAVGAVPLGFAVALASGARSLYAEREGDAMQLRRGFVLRPGERVLVVEDVITTGGSAAEVASLVSASGASLLGVAAMVDRSGTPRGFPLRALVRLEAVSWASEECPLCQGGVPMRARGSRHLAAG